MPACFLTKMAAIGKNDGSEIEQTKTVGLYKWWYCCLIALLHTQYLLTLYTHTLSIHSGSSRPIIFVILYIQQW